MKLFLALLLVAFGFPLVLSAQELPKSFSDCSAKAQTQYAMNACAAAEAKKAEATLDAKYKEALSLTQRRETPEQVNEAIRAIEAAQVAWVRYSDAYLEAIYPGDDKQKQYGTSYPTRVGIVRFKLAIRQIAAMDDLIAEFMPK